MLGRVRPPRLDYNIRPDVVIQAGVIQVLNQIPRNCLKDIHLTVDGFDFRPPWDAFDRSLRGSDVHLEITFRLTGKEVEIADSDVTGIWRQLPYFAEEHRLQVNLYRMWDLLGLLVMFY